MADNLTLTTPRSAAVRARHAASLIVLGPGPTMLMGMRGAGHRFMPNKLVFPGGAVDRGDGVAEAASELSPHVAAMLGKSANPRMARAIAMAAARELEEETGLTLGTPPALAGLDYLGRAITPPASPIRFNARFFVVPDAAVTGTLAGSGELDDLKWWGLEEALQLDLARPTRAVIGLLQEWLVMTPAERASRSVVPVMRMREWVME
jgi:8-oxo-dGTP pyrophosphatase MutT (NUDIX family)